MKHVLLIALVAFALVACGKTNSTSSGTTISSSAATTDSSGNKVASDWATFKAAVNSGDFRYPTYSYVNVYLKSFTTEAEKKKFLGIPYNTYTTSSSDKTWVDNRSTNVFQHDLGSNLAAVKSALASLVNSASGTPVSCGLACFYFISGSKYYAIDLNSPAVANPVSSNSSNNTGYQMLLWQEAY